MTEDPLAGIRWPTPTIAVPAELIQVDEDALRRLASEIEIHVRRDITPDAGWRETARYIVDLVEAYGPEFVERAKVFVDGDRKAQRRAARDGLLRLAKLVEAKIDWIPRYIEPIVWVVVRFGIGRLVDAMLDRTEAGYGDGVR